MLSRSRVRVAVTASLVLASLFGQVAGLSLTYCSPQNTGGTETNGWFWNLQSNGKCSDHCRPQGYAFAIVQDKFCWCSNYAPADTTSISDCDLPCPGYPFESCGSKDLTLWGYILLDSAPAGTIAPTSAEPTKAPPPTPTRRPAPPSPSPTSTEGPTTVFKTVTPAPSVITHLVSPSEPPTTSEEPETTEAPEPTKYRPPPEDTETSTTTSSSSLQMSKYTSVSRLTLSGDVVTQTAVVTTFVGAPAESSKQEEVVHQGVSSGTIAGAVVGGIGGVALLVAGVLFFFWRNRRSQRESQYGGSDSGVSSGVTRNTSVLSKTGLLGSAEKGYLPPVHLGARRSNQALDMDSISPVSERRNSRPLFYDQRLNPSALMDNDNSSRVSVGTLPDNRDYTRTLNIRNPDPENYEHDEPDHNVQAHTR